MSGLVMARVLYVGRFPAYAAFSEEIRSLDSFFLPIHEGAHYYKLDSPICVPHEYRTSTRNLVLSMRA